MEYGQRKETGEVMKSGLVVSLFVLALLASGCEADSDTGRQGEVPVAFGNSVSETRGSDTSGATLTTMGVFASYTQTSDWAATDIPDFMYNTRLSGSVGATWSYSPVKYWPNTSGHKVSFFAYAPYGATGLSFSDKAAAGPRLTYAPPAAESPQADLVVGAALNRTAGGTTGGRVMFALKHALTKVSVFVKSKDDETGKKLTAFSIESAQSGVLTFHTPVDGNDTGFGWSGITGTQAYTPTNAQINIPDKATDPAVALCKFFLLPRGAGSKFSLTYTYTGTISGSGSAPTHTVTLTGQPLPALDLWVPGASVSYTFSIEKAKVTVTASSHPAWSDLGTGTVTIVYGSGGKTGNY